MATPAVPDRLRYNLKATAVDSTNRLYNVYADGTDTYDGSPSSTIRFVIPHSSMDEFCDPTMSRFRMQLSFTIPYDQQTTWIRKFRNDGRTQYFQTRPANADKDRNNPATYELPDEMIHLDRGFESLIRRVEIFDTSGNRIESIDHYNCLYAITELCTSIPEVRRTRGRFTMECLTGTDYDRGTAIWPHRKAKLDANGNAQPITFEITFSLISGVFGGACEKYWPLKAINGLIIELQLEYPVEAFNVHLKPTSHNVERGYAQASVDISENWYNGYGAVGASLTEQQVAITEAHNRWEDYKLGVFKNRADQDIPNAWIRPWTWKYDWDESINGPALKKTISNQFKYTITKPAIQLNNIYLPGTVGGDIIAAGKSMSPDGRIRIQTHSWRVLSTQILANQTHFHFPVPISVSSLKALFFTITPDLNSGNIMRSKTQFIQRNMNAYQFYFRGEPVLNQPVRVQYPNTEAYQELMRAWNIAHKTMDAPTLIRAETYNQNVDMGSAHFFNDPSNCVYGVDLESFASKSNVMDSGINTRNTQLYIELFFDPMTDRNKREWGDSCTLRFYCMYDMFISINDVDGSITNEY